MMGSLARDGLHPDQAHHVPVGVWCDAAWAAYTDLLLRIGSHEHLDALTATWDELFAPPPAPAPAPDPDGDSGERRGPTQAERAAWGAGAAAQAGASNLAAMMGGPRPAGAR